MTPKRSRDSLKQAQSRNVLGMEFLPYWVLKLRINARLGQNLWIQLSSASTLASTQEESGVGVLMDHFWFCLPHQSARPKVMHPDTQQPLHHKDKTSQPQCQRVDSQPVDPSTDSSPLPRPFWDSLIKWKRWLIK